MIAETIEKHYENTTWNAFLAQKDLFACYDSNGDACYEGAMMCELLMDTCNLETTIGVQVLCEEIAAANSAKHVHNAAKLLDFMKGKIDLMKDMRETYENVISNTFD